MKGLDWNNRKRQREQPSSNGGHVGREARRRRRGAKAGRGISLYMEEWNIPEIERMSAAQFEAYLARKFGPEYLEPINYAWQGGEFKPVTLGYAVVTQ